MTDQVFTPRPAVRLLSFLILGILLAQVVSLDRLHAFLSAVCLFVIAVVGVAIKTDSAQTALLLHACVVGCGFALHVHTRESSHSKAVIPRQQNESIIIEGYVGGMPVIGGNVYRFMVRSTVIRRPKENINSERRFLVLSPKTGLSIHLDGLELGTMIALRGTLQPWPVPRNPGEFNYGRYLELNNVHGVVSLKDAGFIKIMDSKTQSVEKIVGRIQKNLYRLVDKYHSSEYASFIKGVALGQRDDISAEMKQSFVDTGTIHILAVSGSNVAVVALMFYSFFGLFRLPKRTLTIATITGLLFYMVITGMSPSVIRATIMAIVILVGMSTERRTDIYNSLGVAGLILLLWDTDFLFDVGFQLSFAAVLSIVYFYPIFADMIKKIPERLEEIKGMEYALKLLAVSLAAQLGTLPFTAYYFGRVSIVSVVANLVVVPVSGLNTILGFTIILVSFASDFVAQCYAALNNVLVGFLLGFVKAAADVPLAYVETANVSLANTFFYYLAVGALFNIPNKLVIKRILIVGFVGANVWIYSAISAQSAPLRVTVLDVGQGDAIFIEFPNKKSILVDVGPKSLRYDSGERIVTPYLKRRGVHSIAAAVISHPHADHVGGLLSILRNFSVRSVIEAVASSDSKSLSASGATSSKNLTSFELIDLGQQIAIDPSVRMYVVHPRLPSDSTSNHNNSSIVLRLLYGSTSLLLTGDAEVDAEKKLSRRYGTFLSSQIIKIGHHGSSTSSGESFLKTVAPRISIISVGLNNKFRHPSQVVIDRLKAMNSYVHQTDEGGAMIIESDGKEWREIHWRD